MHSWERKLITAVPSLTARGRHSLELFNLLSKSSTVTHCTPGLKPCAQIFFFSEFRLLVKKKHHPPSSSGKILKKFFKQNLKDSYLNWPRKLLFQKEQQKISDEINGRFFIQKSVKESLIFSNLPIHLVLVILCNW